MVWRVLKKLNRITSNLTLGHVFRENHNSKGCMYPDIHCSTIYNSQDMEATKLFINKVMNKKDVVCIDNGVFVVVA